MFVGREKELKELKKLYQQKKSLFIVCTGRRRIGKSTLIEEFGKMAPFFYEFQGLHPLEGKNESLQLQHFANRLKIHFRRPLMQFTSWIEAFSELNFLIEKIKSPTILFFDEISWMASGSKTFSSQLKDAWDTLFKKNPHLIVVIAGSVSSWIEDNILNNSNFLGRISWQLNLDELPLISLKEFWKERKNKVSSFDFFKLISVLGGVPRYLEEIDGHESPEQNIQRLCFNKNGFLLYEFDKTFSDIFSRRGPTYKKIVTQLISGRHTLSEIAKKINVEKNGSLSRYLNDLVKSGFIAADTTYDFIGNPSKTVHYRLKDNYLRFALKYLEPHKKRIIDHQFSFTSLENLPGWSSLIGLQFENTILNNKEILLKKLEISPSSVVVASPYSQRKNSKNKGGCQIDLLIVTRNNQIYLCEIKLRSKIPSTILSDFKYKMDVLKRPKYFTIHPVLIYGGDLPSIILKQNDIQLISIDDLQE